MKSMTLEEYIRKSLGKTSEKERSPALGRAGLKKYSDAVTAALERAKRSLPEYGSGAEALAKSGLSRGGYADYIATRVKKGAKNAVLSAEAELAYGDAAELEKMKAGDKRYDALSAAYTNDIISYAKRTRATSYEEIYREALSKGLGKEWASEAAELALDAAKEAEREEKIASARSTIITKRFTERQAYEYALGIGLSHEDANILSSFAERINQLIGYEGSDTGYKKGNYGGYLGDRPQISVSEQ